MRVVGQIDEANVLKLHRFSGKLSYLAYPDFETNPHPALTLRVKVTLPSLSIDQYDYAGWEDPPILCRKDELLPKDHELYTKFRKFSQQEENRGVLTAKATFDRRSDLDLRLRDLGLRIRGHQLISLRP